MTHFPAKLVSLCICLVLSAACKTGAPSPTSEGVQPDSCPTANQEDSTTANQHTTPQTVRYDDVIEREVNFTSAGSTLKATLTLPQSEQTTQRPGVVLLQDWGKSTRRGSTQGSLGIQLPVEVHLYETLAHELARQGFAVLRFDKRNCVQDTDALCSYPREALEPHLNGLGEVLVQDAEQALAALRQQPEVSPARVAVIGHGQGADLALAMTRGVHAPAAIVLLSPSMSPIHEVIAYQTSYSLTSTREQLSRQADDPMADLLRTQIKALEEDKRTQLELFAKISTPANSTDPTTIYGLPMDTWRSFLAVHQRAIAALSDTDRPATLAVLGALDADLPESNAQQFTETLGALPGTRLELLSDTTHDMVLIDEDTPGPPSMHPALSAQISDFLYRNLTRP